MARLVLSPRIFSVDAHSPIQPFAAVRFTLLAIAMIVMPAMGCATFSHSPVADNVVRCRERCQLGLEASRTGDREKAREMYSAAIESCPVDERARRLLAESLWTAGEDDAAVEQMRK
ncbi:MAG: hypothetical protein KDA41_19520, partial [Planctomycetales bacterium]|nr:hypothetical protein [Planctomycetales bacterium]